MTLTTEQNKYVCMRVTTLCLKKPGTYYYDS